LKKDKVVYYEKCGYTWDKSKGEWDEEGMAHVAMFKKVL